MVAYTHSPGVQVVSLRITEAKKKENLVVHPLFLL
jgi:hypothetical protein